MQVTRDRNLSQRGEFRGAYECDEEEDDEGEDDEDNDDEGEGDKESIPRPQLLVVCRRRTCDNRPMARILRVVRAS